MMTTLSYPTRKRLMVTQMKLNRGREDNRYSKRKELREIRFNPLTTSHNLVLLIRIYCCFYIIPINEVKWNLTQLTTRSASVGQRSMRSLMRGQPCFYHLHLLGTAFPSGHSLRLVFGSFFYPHCSPPLFFSTDKSVWQVPGSVGVVVHGNSARVYQPLGCNFF